MGMNVNGLPPEQKFAKIEADGNISFEELQGLTEAEQAEFANKWGCKLPGPGETVELGNTAKSKKSVLQQDEKDMKELSAGAKAVIQDGIIKGSEMEELRPGEQQEVFNYVKNFYAQAGVEAPEHLFSILMDKGSVITLKNLSTLSNKEFGLPEKLDRVYDDVPGQGGSSQASDTSIKQTSTPSEKEQPKFEEDNKVDWKKAGMWAGIGTAAVVGLSAITTLLTKGKVNPLKSIAGLARNNPKVGMIGGIAAASTLGLTSCSNGTEINQNVGISIVTKNSSDEEIIKLLQEQNQELKEIVKQLQEMNFKLDSLDDLKRIVNILTGIGQSIDTIMNMLVELGVRGDLIIQLLQQSNDKQDEILNAITNGNEDIKAILLNILDSVKAGNAIGENNGKLLTSILQVVQKLDKNDQNGQKLLMMLMNMLKGFIENQENANDETHKLLTAILNAITKMDKDMKSGFVAILTKLEQLKQQDKAKYDEIIKLLNTMLAKMDNLDDTMKAGFGAVLGKLDILDDHQTNYFKEILDKLDTMKENDKIFYAEILKRLDKLNGTTLEILKRLINIENITAANYNAIIAILDKLDKLGGQGDRILEILVNIGSSGGNVDLSEIKELLQILIEQGKTNGEILTSIDNKINLMLVVVEGMNKNLGGKLDTIIEKLKALLGKECNHDDLINILIEIKTIIQNEGGSGNGNNEGILDDLEDLLG